MLVRFNNVTVTDVAPTFSDQTEYTINDGSGGVIVRRDGRNSYSNVEADTATGERILHVNDRIGSLTGVMYFSFTLYKIVPRTDADFQGVVSVGEKVARDAAIPRTYALSQNYPNPFNPTTEMVYTLPATSRVTLKIYNILGQEVRTLVNDVQNAGRYTVRFDGGSLASGVYFYHLSAGSFNQVKKMMLVK
jgi:hypothetical protein